MSSLSSQNPAGGQPTRRRGVVYTPEYWADWAVDQFSLHRKWMDGKSILDPGCGTGALTEALIRRARKEGFETDSAALARLSAVDCDCDAVAAFRHRILGKYGLKMPSESLKCADFLLEPAERRFDIVFGNPPWVTFADLGESEKETYRPLFRESGLTPNPKKLLLGGSRVDLSALFVIRALSDYLNDDGEAFFFLPLSLFRSEGAHEAFRRLPLADGGQAALQELRDLGKGSPFPGAGTRYGFAHYRRGCPQTWPIPWQQAEKKGKWKEMQAWPIAGEGSPLVTRPVGSMPPSLPSITVPTGTKPRQGANPCGAAAVFLFDEASFNNDGSVSVRGKQNQCGRLPASMVHPLMSSSNFRNGGEPKAERWIFLPYSRDGRILSLQELADNQDALEWLNSHRRILENRRGSLIRNWIDKGQWWAMLGVGPYAFAPWKLAWESYGRKEFVPILFGPSEKGVWQGNQALHAYLPFYSEAEARLALEHSERPDVTEYLKNLGGEGTRVWAQPGRIRRLLIEKSQNR